MKKTIAPATWDEPGDAVGYAIEYRGGKLLVTHTPEVQNQVAALIADFLKAVRKAGQVRSAATVGSCDLESKYGGVFFYGIHQVDVLLEAFGTDVTAVAVNRARRGAGAVASLFFRSGLVASMHCLTSGKTGFQVSASTDAGIVSAGLVSAPNPYLTGIRRFCKMLKTGKEPLDHKRFLAPIAVLEAMEKSVKTGKGTPVAKV